MQTTRFVPYFEVDVHKDGRPFVLVRPFPVRTGTPEAAFAFELNPGATAEDGQRLALYLQRRVALFAYTPASDKDIKRRATPCS